MPYYNVSAQFSLSYHSSHWYQFASTPRVFVIFHNREGYPISSASPFPAKGIVGKRSVNDVVL